MDNKSQCKKETVKRRWCMWAVMFCSALLILGGLPFSAFAAGGQGENRSARLTHSHDMSVECGNEDALEYIPLTGDENGKLYIDGTEVTINADTEFEEAYVLPEGNYYLADNITISEALVTQTGKRVNLCLNGKTLSFVGDSLHIGGNGTLCMSDCGAGGSITSNEPVLVPADNGHFIMYGGCLECTADSPYVNSVISLLNPDIKAEICGGTIKSVGKMGVYADDGGAGNVLQLSGCPKFEGNKTDVDYTVNLDLKGLNTDPSEKIKVSCGSYVMLAGQSEPVDRIRSLDDKDYSSLLLGSDLGGQYFTYKDGQYYVNMAGITKEPTQEKISVNAVPAEEAAYQWYRAAEQDVTQDRAPMTVYGMTVFTLQAGDTLYFTISETPDPGASVAIYDIDNQNFVSAVSLGNNRFKSTMERDGMYAAAFYSNEGMQPLTFKEGAYKVVRVTKEEAVSGQITNTLTKAAAGTYLCEVAWKNFGYIVNSELVELAEDVDTNSIVSTGWTLDADGKLTIESDEGMSDWLRYRSAFKDMVTMAEIQENVTGIGDCAFQGCSSLEQVTMLSDTPPTLGGSSVFESCPCVAGGTKGILVPAGKADAYKSGEGWSTYQNNITDGTPEITGQPENQSVKNGEEVTFSVTATGMSEPFTYQWQVNKDGTGESGFSDITNAVSDTYTIPAVDKSYNGYKYRCVITNERGSVTSSVVELTVADSDAERVEAAKKIVENALAEIKAGNDTTEQSIQSVIDEALSKAGISDVTATVGDLTKTEATEDAEGSITGTITLILNEESAEAPISLVISKTAPEPSAHPHVYTWVITKEATADAVGEMKGTCTCGEVTTAEIPKTGDGGSGTVVVKEDAENECKGTLTDKTGVITKVPLTEKEREQLNNGENIEIILRLRDVNVAADTSVKAEIQKELGANTLGTFLEVQLLKQIGGKKTEITETTAEIEITFEVPESLRKTDDTVTRTYQIMRNLDGKVDTLDVESYDETTHLLTFRIDKFSTYALVYRDIAGTPAETPTETPAETPGPSSDQGDATPDKANEPQNTDSSAVPGEDAVSEETVISKETAEKNALSLNAKLKVSQTGKKINIEWGKVAGADGYDVYVQYCGMKFTSKSITAIKSGKTTKVTVKMVNGKALNLKKNYKVYVLAYKLVNGKKVTLGKTITGHIVGKNNTKFTNVKAVRVKKKSYALKKDRDDQGKHRTGKQKEEAAYQCACKAVPLRDQQ